MQQTKHNPFNPEKLTAARISRGFTMKELAEKTDISRQMISNYESGKTVPKGENLLKITSILNFPNSYFLTSSTFFHSGATFFRSQSAATKRKRDMQKEHLRFSLEVYNQLSYYVNFPKVNLPVPIDKDIHEITEEDIIEKASELRDAWKLDSISPIENLVGKAEFNGVLISESTMMDDTLDAVSRWVIDRPVIMLTDNNESAVRRRFNIAHELGHLLLHGSVESIHDYSPNELKNSIERQANSFASHFLMPNEAFMNSLLSTSLDFYIELKKYWKVSIQAMVQKTFALELINEDQKLYLNKKISWNKWRKKEPLDDKLTIEKPQLYTKVWTLILENKLLSESELISATHLPKDELSKIVGVHIDPSKNLNENKTYLRIIK